MVAIVLFGLVVVLILATFIITLIRGDIQESSVSISLPFKIELKFKRKADKSKDFLADESDSVPKKELHSSSVH